MSGRQPRLFAMNRYSVIQSVFKPKEKEKLLALEVSQEDIDNPDKEKELGRNWNLRRGVVCVVTTMFVVAHVARYAPFGVV